MLAMDWQIDVDGSGTITATDRGSIHRGKVDDNGRITWDEGINSLKFAYRRVRIKDLQAKAKKPMPGIRIFN